MPGSGSRRGVDMRRAAAVLLLVAVAAVGLRAGGAFSATGGHEILGLSGLALYWALAIAELILALAGLILLAARLYWARKGGIKLERKRRSLWWVLLIPVMVFFLSRTLAYLRRHGSGLHLGTQRAGAGGGSASHQAPGSSPWPVLAMFAVAALAAGALIVYRRRRRAAALVFPPLAPDRVTEPLAEALAAGAQALQEDSDPRAAIIGCYAAMERSLTDAGSPARVADTPAEVLARATASGLVRSTWAGTLTGLFRRARYSSHPMTEADRAAAKGALAQVRADLVSADPATGP